MTPSDFRWGLQIYLKISYLKFRYFCSGFAVGTLVDFAIWTACLSPFWGALLWSFWQGSVRPRLIPRREIVAKVEEVYARHGERAFDFACSEEYRAWYDSDAFEQGRWRRVREEIMRRERALGYAFHKI